MASIKGEILHNLFRSTSNLMAFEQFLANLPTHLLAAESDGDQSAGRPAGVRQNPLSAGTGGLEPDDNQPPLTLPIQREAPKVGRNEPCPCGSGKKFKNCCGRMA